MVSPLHPSDTALPRWTFDLMVETAAIALYNDCVRSHEGPSETWEECSVATRMMWRDRAVRMSREGRVLEGT